MKVLMVGPGEGVTGGIASLVDTLVPVLSDRVELHYLPTVKQRSLSKSGRWSAENALLAISQYSRFLLALWRFRPEVIHLHTSRGLGWLKDTFYIIAGKLCRRHVVVHIHQNAADFVDAYGRAALIATPYSRLVMKLVDAVITMSPEWMGHPAKIAPQHRTFILPNCVIVDPQPERHSPRHATRPIGLFLGSIGPGKGVFDLLAAMAQLKARGCALDMVVAGYEEREGELAKAVAMASELGLESVCRVVGPVASLQRTELLREADIFVLPTYHDCLPMALLEALAAGLPAISTPVGGIASVIRDGCNGFLVRPGDVDALVEKLAALSSDVEMRRDMGRRSYEFAQAELDVRGYVEQLVELYQQAARLPRHHLEHSLP